MREKKKSLSLRKFKVANLRASWLKGGTNSNPCNVTLPSGASAVGCTAIEYTCPIVCDDDTTNGHKKTTPRNPCNGDNADGINTGPGCP